MPIRFCVCGQQLGISGKKLCWKCKEKQAEEVKEQTRQERLAQAAAVGKILVHSCLANQFDPAPGSCTCKKLVDHKAAEALVDGNQAVDLDTRSKVFCKRAIVLIGKLKMTPRAQTIEKTHIERAVVDGRQSFEELFTDVAELQRRVAADKASRNEEERVRWDIYRELELEARASLIVAVPEEQWLADRAAADGIPAVPLAVGFDQRTPGGIGVDVVTAREVPQEYDQQEDAAEEVPMAA